MKSLRRLTGAALFFVCMLLQVFISGCGDSTYVSGSSSLPPPVTAKTAASLKKTIDDHMTSAGAGIPGAIVAVKMNGYQPWYYATGSAEINLPGSTPKTAMKADMPFRIASITKMFIAQTVLQLAKEGKIDLTKSVDYYLPGALTGRNAANAGKITINMLLNHTSGLYSYVTSDAGLLNGNTPTPQLPMNMFLKKLGQDAWTHSVSPQDDILTFVNTFNPPTSINVPAVNNVSSVGNPYSTNPYFAPGAGFHYSNTNYYLLGLLIEKVTGKTVESEIDRLIIKPLGLTDTYLPTAKTFSNPNHVHGYTDYFNNESYKVTMEDALLTFHLNTGNTSWINGDGILEDFSNIDPSFPWTTGGMISSARDLLTFNEFIMKSRVQTGQEAGTWILGTPTDNSTSFQYGRGIARINNSMFGHSGQFAGYNVAAYWYSTLDVYVVVMTNKYSYFEGNPNDIGATIVAGSDSLYKLASKTGSPAIDPNTAMINGILGALEQDPAMGKALKKVTPFSFPDVTSLMR